MRHDISLRVRQTSRTSSCNMQVAIYAGLYNFYTARGVDTR
jgi:hypothetical protein